MVGTTKTRKGGRSTPIPLGDGFAHARFEWVVRGELGDKRVGSEVPREKCDAVQFVKLFGIQH